MNEKSGKPIQAPDVEKDIAKADHYADPPVATFPVPAQAEAAPDAERCRCGALLSDCWCDGRRPDLDARIVEVTCPKCRKQVGVTLGRIDRHVGSRGRGNCKGTGLEVSP